MPEYARVGTTVVIWLWAFIACSIWDEYVTGCPSCCDWTISCGLLPMVWSTRLVCRLVISDPRNTWTPMPTAMPAAMRMDWTGLLRRNRAAMPRLSMSQPSSPRPSAASGPG